MTGNNYSSELRAEREHYLQLVSTDTAPHGRQEEIRNALLFSFGVLALQNGGATSNSKKGKAKEISPIFPQYAFLGLCVENPEDEEDDGTVDTEPETMSHKTDPESTAAQSNVRSDQTADPIILNINAPFSVFICGSQGSGKSHTMSCMLEGCLSPDDRIGRLPNPLSGIVFYFAAADSAACEAAYLCSLGIKVIVPSTNLSKRQSIYSQLSGAKENLTVEELFFLDTHLNAASFQELMAFSNTAELLLYMMVVKQVLRNHVMGSANQRFDFFEIRNQIRDSLKKKVKKNAAPSDDPLKNLSPQQKTHLSQRLSLIDAMVKSSKNAGKDLFKAERNTLTITDLSDLFIDAAAAYALFKICMSVFLEDQSDIGRVVALDEAHNYLGAATVSKEFGEALLKAIREQRHIAARVIIAT
ncbi:hypothetical protein NA57DRAFT_76748 [Rhizodiscina lignyota]|uniref:Uncharacterized protein n=1 Tax=Rhizodiscina lignyota TaxID=1504668 RepID=A0A9P4M5D7_9PEZI|nr:hypothetical protein NA57DRAFT_76748 [Rhizodiscina lignyota]